MYKGGVDRPTHPQLTAVFTRYGFDDVAPYHHSVGGPNKESRVRKVLEAVVRRPRNARQIVEDLLVDLRALGRFTYGVVERDVVLRLGAAFGGQGYELTFAGELRHFAAVDLSTGRQPALDEPEFFKVDESIGC